jgi:predicted DNA-binding WGR domain protein
MSAIILTRSDAARNMRRYYRPDVQPDLFGHWCLIREWGRIGSAGQMRNAPYPTPAEADAALNKQRQAKERRGYSATNARIPPVI